MNNSTKKEIWKDVKGFEGKYEVSSLGKIRNKNNSKILKEQDHNGYKRVYLNDGSKQRKKRVHRIVAEAFLEPSKNPKRTMINHKDSDRKNNSVNNLEWCSHRENILHATQKGNIKCNRDYTKSVDRDIEVDVKVIRYMYETTRITQEELASLFNMSTATVFSIINLKTHKKIDSLS